jgi:hypothetical protein
MDHIELAQDSVQKVAVLNIVKNCQVPLMAEGFLYHLCDCLYSQEGLWYLV